MRLVFFIVFGCCFIPIFAMIMIVFFKMVFKHHKKMRTAAKKLNSNYLEYFGEDNVFCLYKVCQSACNDFVHTSIMFFMWHTVNNLKRKCYANSIWTAFFKQTIVISFSTP